MASIQEQAGENADYCFQKGLEVVGGSTCPNRVFESLRTAPYSIEKRDSTTSCLVRRDHGNPRNRIFDDLQVC